MDCSWSSMSQLYDGAKTSTSPLLNEGGRRGAWVAPVSHLTEEEVGLIQDYHRGPALSTTRKFKRAIGLYNPPNAARVKHGIHNPRAVAGGVLKHRNRHAIHECFASMLLMGINCD